MFKKVLVCLDGSNLAEQIMPYSSEEARYFNSKLILLRVITSYITIPPGGTGYVSPPLRATEPRYGAAAEAARSYTEAELSEIEKEDNEAKTYLESMAQQFRDKGLNVETVTIQGEAGEAIRGYAGNNAIDLIAMATHGRGGLGRAVFGSVANYVLRKSGVPVLLIRPKETGTQQLLEAKPFKKIMVCLDGSKIAEQIVPYATEQALRFNSKMVLFRAIPEPILISPNIPGSAGMPVWTPEMERRDKKEEGEAKAYLEAKAEEILREKGLYVDCVSMQGAAGEVILGYADDNGIDLITIATHGRSGLGRAVFGSVADFVLHKSAHPILAIKPQEIKT